MSVLRDIFRRRLRSALTICGIAVGVFALVVLGAMAEKANVTLDKSADYYTDKITVVEKKAGTIFGYNTSTNRPLSYEKIAEVKSYPGVLDAAPQVALSLDQEAMPVGVPSLVIGGFVGTDKYAERWKAVEGRMVSDSEHGVAVVGPDLVKQLGAELGATVHVRGQDFEVVGIAERSNTMIDQAVLVPLSDAQAILANTFPPAFIEAVDPAKLAMQATVYVKPGYDANEVAARLNRDVAGIQATGPTKLKQQLGQMIQVLSAILASVASIALVIGCLSVVNTMMMSMSERNREVGIKRALGASKWRVAREVVGESAVMGVLGGLVGIVAAVLAVAALNAASNVTNGTTMFMVTGRLGLVGLAFAAFLGGVAGLYPAWRTSRLDPSSALASR